MGNLIFCASENKDPKCNEMNVDVFSKHKGSSPIAMFVTVHCECLKQISEENTFTNRHVADI